MKYGNILVEQVDSEGKIVDGYDTSLSTSEIYSAISRYFPNISKGADKIIYGNYGGVKYSIRVKNVTYLGNPHPVFKKRIQISDDLQTFYRNSISCGCTPLLLGIYSFKDNLIFCDFNIDDFVNKKAHNSSAHIYTSDLSDATIYGFFQKTDYFGNQVTAFSSKVVTQFLENKLIVKSDLINYFKKNDKTTAEKTILKKPSISQIPTQIPTQFPKEITNEIRNFFKEEDKIWDGIQCYKKMIADNYRNKFQPEWPGFYLEFEFEKYIISNQIDHLVHYHQDKSKGGIDLDLYFPTINNYGDLKAHSDHSRGIQGNDWDTVVDTVNKYGHIYYIVCEHSTKKDSEGGYVVTRFWNSVQSKQDLMSYSKRMKNQITLKRVYILDINSENLDYLTIFRQGINSDGKPRSPKIMIEVENLSRFIIEVCDLV